jgi:hypothetical protein
VAGRALTPATRLRLGEPLPHQLPDRSIADPKAASLWSFDIMGYYASFPMPIPHLGARSILLLTLSPLTIASPFDLHALTTPPAFNLSQNQTLHLFAFDQATIAGDRFMAVMFDLEPCSYMHGRSNLADSQENSI